ncbi:uncharacterized protein LOC128200484 [Galleria mellonella]|uniref:Uncharacterized protein LOC128200484 n=1 Tax=Galleria mellonella TaxID=7137 RepID=A0ABM3MF47_GALME|nr:uncharacterized protein LOC128200484 [Galleria mellonella]
MFKFYNDKQAMETFIRSVKSNPCLWDLTNKKYRDLGIKNKTWALVAHECNMSNKQQAKAYWHRLRYGLRNALRRRKRGYLVNACWMYEKQMEFILPYLGIKHYLSSIAVGSDVSDSPLLLPRDALTNLFSSLYQKTRDLPKHLQLRVQREISESVTRAEEEVLLRDQSRISGIKVCTTRLSTLSHDDPLSTSSTSHQSINEMVIEDEGVQFPPGYEQERNNSIMPGRRPR